MQQAGDNTESHTQQQQQQAQYSQGPSVLMGGGVGPSDQQVVEEASPISSRPPAGNFDELMHDESGGGGGGSTSGGGGGNRWPKQETLALIEIRSDMDAVFRDAPLKGPLWEDVSRKLAELGYKRSAKKCKEKFENVHKYYKRTKEGRAGRQDGKSYKFFSQLEALHTNTITSSTATNTNITTTSNVSASLPMQTTSITTTSTNFVPLAIGISNTSNTTNPMPLSSIHPTTLAFTSSQVPSSSMFPPNIVTTTTTTATTTNISTPIMGISFSSDDGTPSSSSLHDSDEDEEMEEGSSKKRKRASKGSSGGSSTKMMEFFENLMKQVMQKQEVMQQRFLEAIEKREQDRMIREEAWKRQEMARLSREHEIMAQERAIAAQRDAAIVSFLQKITGQTIQLPQHVSSTNTTMPSNAPPPTQATPQQPASVPTQQHQHQHQQHQQLVPQQQIQQQQQQSQPTSRCTDVVIAVPEQQVPPQEASGSGGSFEPSSSRWPKAEVLALINLRSGLDSRYQEAGPKGPLWEEISAGMGRLGYKRSAKRCKEKWENINKYFKKVKESNKKRPEDSKTCPYFHQLDALYRQKTLVNTSGGSSSYSGFGNQLRPEQQHQQQQESIRLDSATSASKPQEGSEIPENTVQVTQPTQATESENKNGSSGDVQTSNVGLPGNLFGEQSGEATQKPEDIMKELMEQQNHQEQQHQQLTVDDYEHKMDEPDSDNLDQDDYEDEDEEDDEELEEQRKMAYKIEFQRQSTNATGPPNGGGNGAPSFLAMSLTEVKQRDLIQANEKNKLAYQHHHQQHHHGPLHHHHHQHHPHLMRVRRKHACRKKVCLVRVSGSVRRAEEDNYM